jgi:hypothetical protein
VAKLQVTKNNIMKKVNLNGKLSLVKESISKLNDLELNMIKGGVRLEKHIENAFRHKPSSPMICKSRYYAVNEQ